MIPLGLSRFGVIVRVHRLYSDQPLEPGSPARLEGRSAHYLGRVLRVAVGDNVVLFNGDGQDYACTVEQIRKDTVALDVRSRLPAKPESPLCITVVQAVSRGERMDLTLQKCTELGAAAFQPVWSERVEVRRLYDLVAHESEVGPAVIVSNDQDDVGIYTRTISNKHIGEVVVLVGESDDVFMIYVKGDIDMSKTLSSDIFANMMCGKKGKDCD